MTDTGEDELFAQLAETWQADTAPVIDQLERKVDTALRRDRLLTSIDLVVATVGVLYGLWELYAGSPVIGGAAVAFAGVSLLLVIDYRRRESEALTEPVSVQLQRLFRVERNRYRRGWAGIVVCLLAQCFLAVLMFADPSTLTRPNGQILLGGALAFTVVGLLISVRQVVRGRVVSARLQALSREA